ncbi:PP2C family protein-serine/threonine phosphatase [Flaviflexus massiliensis]|uniref:PP2C family protein-serine/threonine phosphatase n=1 Tax=Flaviflexus massiliensis TaxID=1522309 RepID=UPI0006D55C2F|nr:protein phosphatase 2C domain-containing protein [Flaviflexus massiliensis]
MNTTKAPRRTRPRIETGFATSIGNVRDKQEDRYLGGDPIIAVADGMGGLSRGDVAAETVIDTLSAITFTGTTVQARKEIRKALAKASAKLAKSAQKKNASESGTTVVGAVLGRGTAKNCWLVFHVGDSRLYSFGDGELIPLTTDHSIVQELVDTGALTPAQARIDPRRSIVTRAIGTAVPAEPDFRLVEATGQLLMACSDGITDELDDEDIAWILEQNADLELDELAQKLVDSALEVGGHDNATVVLARAIPDTMVTTREGSSNDRID